MPELPEVETIRRQLEPLVQGATLTDAWAFPSAKFTPAVEAVGATITSVGRRGKYLLLGLDRAPDALEMIVHLGMTGRLSVRGSRPHDTVPSRSVPSNPVPSRPVPSDSVPSRSAWRASVRSDGDEVSHLRARWWMSEDTTLDFTDTRRFGRIAVVPAGEHAALATLAALGPEPFDEAFDAAHLRRRVNESSRAVKTQLLGQRVVAGVGNIYADEALWLAGVHPRARRLTWAQAHVLRDALRTVLETGLAHGGTTLRDYRTVEGAEGSNAANLACYGRAGRPCRRCGELLRRDVVDARATSWCPRCQRRR